jgi:hypothetical protein
MSKSKFMTPSQIKTELLKQTLLQEAFNSKPYYEDGFYKPATVKNDQAKNQRQLYDAIDEIGYRLSTPDYYFNTPAGESYRNNTDAKANKIISQIMEQTRSGLMSSQTYNDIMAYFSNMYHTSRVGDSGISIATQKRLGMTDKDSVQKQLQNAIAQNITLNPSSQIQNLEKQLGMNNEDIKLLLQSMEAQQATDKRQIADSMNALNQQIGQTGQQIVQQTGEYGNNIMSVLNKDGAYNTNYARQSNIHDPLVPDQTGDADTTIYNTNASVDPDLFLDNQIPANKGDTDAEQRESAFIGRFDKESEDMATKNYGLPIDAQQRYSAIVSALVANSLSSNAKTSDFTVKLNVLIKDISTLYPNFNSMGFTKDYENLYSDLLTKKINENIDLQNMAESPEGKQADAVIKELNEDQNINTVLNQGTLPTTVNKNEAKSKASMGSIPIFTQLANEINASEGSTLNEAFNNIMNNNGTVAPVPVFEAVNDMVAPLYSGLALVPLLSNRLFADIRDNTLTNLSENELYTIKNLFDSESLKLVINKFNSHNFRTWKSVADLSNDKSLNAKQINSRTLNAEKLWKKTGRELDQNPVFWRLKRMLSSSSANTKTVYKKFMEDYKKQSTASSMEGEGKRKPMSQPKKYGGVISKMAEPAPTTQIPDPPMRYSVGGSALRQNKRNYNASHDITIS